MNFRQRLARFFYGRYGIDGLYWFLFALYFILWLVLLFIPNITARLVLSLVQYTVLFYMLFRSFSRNIYKRRRENEVFMKLFSRVKGFFILTKNRLRDIKTHSYKKCPHCKAVLRLPKRKGEGSVICPRCKNRFIVKGRL